MVEFEFFFRLAQDSVDVTRVLVFDVIHVQLFKLVN